MIVETKSGTNYEVRGAQSGQGLVEVRGHEKYCKTWTRFQLVEPIVVGQSMRLKYDPKLPEHRAYLETSEVTRISYAGF